VAEMVLLGAIAPGASNGTASKVAPLVPSWSPQWWDHDHLGVDAELTQQASAPPVLNLYQ
jgi:hypothetical protein